MAKDTFLLVSLEDDQANTLTQVLSNKTSRKILDYLSEGSCTETKLAKELDIPLSTVHYNLQQLVKAQLVHAKEYHYSEKGKEVLHYSLANKYVIIAPKKTPTGFKEKLKRILPALLGVGVVGFIYQLLNSFKMSSSLEIVSAPIAKEAIVESLSMGGAEQIAADTAIHEGMREGIIQTMSHNIWIWLFIGAIVALGTYLLVDYIIKKK